MKWLVPATPLACCERHWLDRLQGDATQAERNEGDYRDVVTRYDILLASSRRRDDTASVAAALCGRAHVEWHLGHAEQALELLARVIAILSDANRLVVGTAGELVGTIAGSCSRAQWTAPRVPLSSRPVSAPSLVDEALLAFATRDQSVATTVHAKVAGAQLVAGVPTQARATCDAWLDLRPRTESGDPFRRADSTRATPPAAVDQRQHAFNLICIRALAIARLEGLDAGLAALARASELLHGLSTGEEAELATVRGLLAYWDGRWSDAEREYGSVLRDSDHPSPGRLDLLALDGLGCAYRELGLLSEAGGAAKRAREIDAAAPRPKALLAEVELLRGNLEAAEDWATQTLAALEGSRSAPSTSPVASAASRVLAEIALARGHAYAAFAPAQKAVAFERLTAADSDPSLTRVLLTLGRVEASLGRASADDTFRAAIGLRARADHPWRLEALREYAEFLDGEGRHADAMARRAEADAALAASSRDAN